MSAATVTTNHAAPERRAARAEIEVFSACPQSIDWPQGYLQKLLEVARWSEWAGCKGILVYTDNQLVDPWLVAQLIIQNTRSLCPLVAVQPVYMHPYTVANMVTSYGFLHGRRMYLNIVAGGFKNDLTALADNTPHDRRYDRLVEYTQVIKGLLAGGPFTYEGEFYKVDKLTLKPALASALMPGIFVSGSSEAGLAASRAIGATAVKYPGPPEGCRIEESEENKSFGVRVGIIARDREERAWEIAKERFPDDRKGQIKHQLAMKVSDSLWHKQLSDVGEGAYGDRSVYWLGPFQNYKTFCPYLVGSYRQVADYLRRYIEVGYRAFILDIPASEEELEHINTAFNLATEGVAK